MDRVSSVEFLIYVWFLCMAEGIYARNFSATLLYELVYDLLLVSVMDKLS